MFATAYLAKWHQNWIDREEEAREDKEDEEFEPDKTAAVESPKEPREPSKRKRGDDGGARANYRRLSLGASALNVAELEDTDTLEDCFETQKEEVVPPATTPKACKTKHCIADPFECSAGQVDAKVILIKHVHY
jgi:hypothetical protein